MVEARNRLPVQIPANSTHIIHVVIRASIPDEQINGTCIYTPPCTLVSGLLIKGSVGIIRDCTTVMEVTNLTNHAIGIRKNKHLCILREVDTCRHTPL